MSRSAGNSADNGCVVELNYPKNGEMGEIEMTVKELYEFAKEHGMEDCKIIISNNNDFEVGYDDEITPCAVEDIVVLEV